MLPKKKNLFPNDREQKAVMLAEIRDFSQHPALIRLMQAFGFYPPHHLLDLEHQLLSQKNFSNEQWDFRKGRERLDAKSAHLTNEEKQTVLQEIEALNLVEAIKPRKTHYDGIVILGGRGMSPLLRTQYAFACGVKAPFIFSLSSENEFPKANPAYKTYAPHAITEFDLMSAAAEKIYKRTLATAQTIMLPLDRWRIRQYKKPSSRGPEIFIVSAPSSHPSRRANTADTYAFLANLLPFDINDLLMVTSSNFRPFQHFDARRMLTLPFGKNIETVGLATTKTIYTEPQHYLQEINSAINSAYDLYTALTLH